MRGIIFISDQRLSYAADYLREAGISLTEICCAEDFTSDVSREADTFDFVLLAIRGSDDGTLPLGEEILQLDDFLHRLKADAVVISGVTTPYEQSLPCEYFCFQTDPSFVAGNSKITAEGILKILLDRTPKSLYAYTYDILGAGNVGTRLNILLNRLELPVRLIDARDLPDVMKFADWAESEPADVIINTVPVETITEVIVTQWKKPKIIVDISSREAGTADSVKTKKDITYIPTPPLPGLVAPETAGKLIQEMIIRKMTKS
ncbi:MAG: hypothetical protein LIO92_04200 [Clostridiales bacterium]|nr:hypothetical protein [Clostridiales bacterium]